MYEVVSASGQPAYGEVLDQEAYIETIYGKLGIEATLGAYLDGGAGEEDVSA